MIRVSHYGEASQPAREFLREWSGRQEVLILASARRASDDLVRDSCDGAFAGVHRFSLREFVMAAASAPMNQRGLVPVRRIAREALAAQATNSVRQRLGYFAPVSNYPGFPRALARTLEQLRLNRVSPTALRKCGPASTDLALLLEAYESELRARSLADHATRATLAIEAVQSQPGRALMLFDVEPQSALEQDLVDALRSGAPPFLDITRGAEAVQPRTCIQSLRRYVLAGETVPAHDPDETFEMFSASGESLECVEVVRRIASAAKSGVPFDSVAVLLRTPDRYQPLLRDAFRRAGIPAFFAYGVRKPDPAGRALLALLNCTAENYSAAAFAEYLSLGQMPAESGEVRAPAQWERLLADAAVVGGKDRWARRLRGLTEEYFARYETALDAAEQARYARTIGWLESLAGFALPILERLEQLPRSGSWGEWIDALYELARVTLKDPGTVHALLDQLEPMSEIGGATLGAVLQVVSTHLMEARDDSDNDRYGKVFIGSIEEAVGMSFRHVYIPGVNEGLFPRLASEDPLLLDDQCIRLGIPASRDDGDLLRTAIACASDKVAISWSRVDLLTGRERVPSFYAFEALKSARGSDVDISAFEAESKQTSEARIGWPAPHEPAVAIDDLEFDLAYLRAPWQDRTPGAAAYLKQVNSHAVRSLRNRMRRWKRTWTSADGLVAGDVHVALITGQHKPSQRPWSVSTLQQFARCPYRFALKGIYGLEPAERPEPVQRLDPLTRGRIYHEAQFALLEELRSAKQLPVTQANIGIALEYLNTVLERIASAHYDRCAPAIDQVWRAGVESIHADLRGWLQYKAAVEPDWTPEYFELAFGLKDLSGHDVWSAAEPVQALPNLMLRGSIDLVEHHPSKGLRVVDHKTGRPPAQRVDAVGRGEHLQPALYALAAERLLNQPVGSGRLFYATLQHGYAATDIPIHEGVRRRTEQVIAAVDEALESGFLPAAPRKDGCKGCEYLPICGPWEEERVQRKSRRELRSLDDIRRLT